MTVEPRVGVDEARVSLIERFLAGMLALTD